MTAHVVRAGDRIAWCTVAMMCVLASTLAHAAGPQGDDIVEKGDHLARLICANCHIVADNQQVPQLASAIDEYDPDSSWHVP